MGAIPFLDVYDVKETAGILAIPQKEALALIDKGKLLGSRLNGKKILIDKKSLESYIENYGGAERRYKELIIQKVHTEQDRYIKDNAKVIEIMNQTNRNFKDKIEYIKKSYEGLESKQKEMITPSKKRSGNKHRIITKEFHDLVLESNELSDTLAKKFAELPLPISMEKDFKSLGHKEVMNIYETIKLKGENAKQLKKLISIGLTEEVILEHCETDKRRIIHLDNGIFVLELDRKIFQSLYEEECRVKRKKTKYVEWEHANFFKTYKSNLQSYEKIKFLPYSEVKAIILECRIKLNYKVKCEKE